LHVVDFARNPHKPEFGAFGSLSVRYGKAMAGGPPRRCNVLTVFDWAVEVIEQYVREIRPLYGRDEHPALRLDAKVEKVRDGGRVVNKALVIAHAVHESGRREILSIDVGEAETEAFWTSFLRSLVKRGLVGVQLAISDAHAGLKAAIAKVLGCAWQRCTVHFQRDCLGHGRRDQHGLLGALIRPVFAADSLAQARDRLSEAVAHLDGRLAKVAAMLEDAEADILAFYAFPVDHWRKLRSTNPLERFNREVGRRTDVVGIFPDDQSLIRLAGMLCIEQNDEWLVGRRYLSAESISLVLAGRDDHPNKIKEEVARLQPA
jgi:transposase-like protein